MKPYHTPYGGVLVEAKVFNLPNKNMPGATDLYAMHIHQNGGCSDSFTNTGEHYSPTSATHLNHASDMVPLPRNEGYVWTAFYGKHFKIEDILGRSAIIHGHLDDPTTQFSGNSDGKIAYGTIMKADYTDQVWFLHLGTVLPECVWNFREYTQGLPEYTQDSPECV